MAAARDPLLSEGEVTTENSEMTEVDSAPAVNISYG